ncbi:hypothetical protein H1235_14730 [Pseudoxanthomonas sp. NC8]|nr:hypothetical protein H1235_14730 [Pseudoxanthomonas sp. NC8]
MKAAWGTGLLLCAATASAKEQPIALSDADAAALRGKTVALTVHERPSFVAMTLRQSELRPAGDGGDDLRRKQDRRPEWRGGSGDPGPQAARPSLGRPLRRHRAGRGHDRQQGHKTLGTCGPASGSGLRLRRELRGWQFAYFPTDWNNYWMAYSVQTRLVDTRTGRQLASMGCNAHTKEHARPPSHDQLLEHDAGLLKAVTQHL